MKKLSVIAGLLALAGLAVSYASGKVQDKQLDERIDEKINERLSPGQDNKEESE